MLLSKRVSIKLHILILEDIPNGLPGFVYKWRHLPRLEYRHCINETKFVKIS